MASCAIPGWYAPVTIDGRRYVDGGTPGRPPASTCWPTEGLDEVYVLAPMASFVDDHPRQRRGPAGAPAAAPGDPAAAAARPQRSAAAARR